MRINQKIMRLKLVKRFGYTVNWFGTFGTYVGALKTYFGTVLDQKKLNVT